MQICDMLTLIVNTHLLAYLQERVYLSSFE